MFYFVHNLIFGLVYISFWYIYFKYIKVEFYFVDDLKSTIFLLTNLSI